MTTLSVNIIPAILVHFFFDFETQIVVMNSREVLIAESIRGMLMFIIAIWLTYHTVINKAAVSPKC